MTSKDSSSLHQDSRTVEMPQSTAAPIVLALGIALLAGGIPFGLGFLVVGAIVLFAGLGMWISQLLPGQGHQHESLAEPTSSAEPVPGKVPPLQEGMPGYRLLLPQAYHPVSSGVKGGIVGGIVMPIPAIIWGLMTGYGVWYPINLVAGMVLPGVGKMTDAALMQFQLPLFLIAVVIHAIMSATIGLIYGVLLPTLPGVPQTIAWGGLLAPLLWAGITYAMVNTINPLLEEQVSWPWFISAQFIFGAIVTGLIRRSGRYSSLSAGLCGGLAGCLIMPVHAFIGALANGHSIWYPINVLAGVVLRELGDRSAEDLELFNAHWLFIAGMIHLCLSIIFGIIFGLFLPLLPNIPGPLAWGGLILPLLWSGICFGLMGIVNPVLQERVDWAGFVVSQFVFGLVAAVVVLRSELIPIPPIGGRA